MPVQKKTPMTKKYTFGTCAYAKTHPQRSALSPSTKVLNIHLMFEEALKLNVAVDECVRKLNSYKKSTTAGKKASLNLTIHLDLNRVAVTEDYDTYPYVCPRQPLQPKNQDSRP